MKITVDIPDDELEDTMRYTRATTKREAIVTAIVEFNRRRRMAELARLAGTCAEMMTPDEMHLARVGFARDGILVSSLDDDGAPVVGVYVVP